VDYSHQADPLAKNAAHEPAARLCSTKQQSEKYTNKNLKIKKE
jgi:hypothetical protein